MMLSQQTTTSVAGRQSQTYSAHGGVVTHPQAHIDYCRGAAPACGTEQRYSTSMPTKAAVQAVVVVNHNRVPVQQHSLRHCILACMADYKIMCMQLSARERGVTHTHTHTHCGPLVTVSPTALETNTKNDQQNSSAHT